MPTFSEDTWDETVDARRFAAQAARNSAKREIEKSQRLQNRNIFQKVRDAFTGPGGWDSSKGVVENLQQDGAFYGDGGFSELARDVAKEKGYGVALPLAQIGDSVAAGEKVRGADVAQLGLDASLMLFRGPYKIATGLTRALGFEGEPSREWSRATNLNEFRKGVPLSGQYTMESLSGVRNPHINAGINYVSAFALPYGGSAMSTYLQRAPWAKHMFPNKWMSRLGHYVGGPAMYTTAENKLRNLSVGALDRNHQKAADAYEDYVKYGPPLATESKSVDSVDPETGLSKWRQMLQYPDAARYATAGAGGIVGGYLGSRLPKKENKILRALAGSLGVGAGSYLGYRIMEEIQNRGR